MGILLPLTSNIASSITSEDEIVVPGTGFEFTVDTTQPGSASDTFIVPTDISVPYGCTVFWGDGSKDTITSYNDAAWTHVYPSPDVYNIRIEGTFGGIYFNNTGDKSKILNISNWGPDFRLGNTGGYFYGCNNLIVTATDQLNMTGTTTLQNAFRGCSVFTGWSQIGSLDVSAVTSMNSTFFSCSAFNADIGSWNVRNATDKASMFENCVVFNQSLNSWDMELTTTLYRFLISCSSYNQRFDDWNLSSCTTLFDFLLFSSFLTSSCAW